MKQFRKSLLSCLGWLAASELLCLVLAFSFAILRPEWIRWLSMGCGITAHVLLMGNCGQALAKRHTALFHQSGTRISSGFPVLLAFCTALPLWILYAILWANADSSAVLNGFLLLNAPYIQLHRLLLNGAEPFSAVPLPRQILMGLPPLVTAASVYIGYRLHYAKGIAEIRSRQHNPS